MRVLHKEQKLSYQFGTTDYAFTVVVPIYSVRFIHGICIK